MNTKHIKAFLLASLFGGATLITSCDTGTDPGETNVERSEIIEEGSLDEGYTSDDYPADDDTIKAEKHYEDAEGAVHAGDGRDEGVEDNENQ